jgi:hypothetical protein
MRAVVRILGTELKGRGFRADGRYFRRAGTHVTDIVHIQGSSSNSHIGTVDEAEFYVNLFVYHTEFQALRVPGLEPNPFPKGSGIQRRLAPDERQGSWRTNPGQLQTTADRFRAQFDTLAEPWLRQHDGTLEDLLAIYEQLEPLRSEALLIRDHLGTASVWWDRYDARMAQPTIDDSDEYIKRTLEYIASHHTRPAS